MTNVNKTNSASESRMLFRMVHQPCAGRCYAGDEVLGLKGLGLDVSDAAELLSQIVRIHEPACGREQIGYALDFCEGVGVYVATFVRFGQISTYVNGDPLLALRGLIDGALEWYATDEARELLAANPGDGKDACEHGNDRDLMHFAVQHSGVSSDQQRALLSELRA